MSKQKTVNKKILMKIYNLKVILKNKMKMQINKWMKNNQI